MSEFEVGQRVRVINAIEDDGSIAQFIGHVGVITRHQPEGSFDWLVKFESGDATWFYPAEIELASA